MPTKRREKWKTINDVNIFNFHFNGFNLAFIYKFHFSCDPVNKKCWILVYNTASGGKKHKCVETWANGKRINIKCVQTKNQ